MSYLLFMGVSMANRRHKHADLIHAWAEGAIIQFEYSPGKWEDCIDNDPAWDEAKNYRIKPAKKVIRFRNWLMKSGDIVTHQKGRTPDPTQSKNFVGWVCGWQEVDVEVEGNNPNGFEFTNPLGGIRVE